MTFPLESNLAQAVIQRLVMAGYEVYQGDGDLMPVDVWWWTWADPSGRGDVITGPDCGSQEQAWQTAMEDFFDNAGVPAERQDTPYGT